MSDPLTHPGEGFHPHLVGAPDHPAAGSPRTRLHHVRAGRLDGDTAQSGGMRRFAAISGSTTGSEKLWMGQTHVAPATASSDHHHGASETAIHVVSGHPEFVFLEPADDGGRGRYVCVPHRATTSSYPRTYRTARRTPIPPKRRSSSSPAAPRRRSSSTCPASTRSCGTGDPDPGSR